MFRPPTIALSVLIAGCSSPKPDLPPDPWDSSADTSLPQSSCTPDESRVTIIVTRDGEPVVGHEVQAHADGATVLLATGGRGCVFVDGGSDVLIAGLRDDEVHIATDLLVGDVVRAQLPGVPNSTELAIRLPRSVFQATRYVARVLDCDAQAGTHDPGQTLRMAVPARCHDGAVDVFVSAINDQGRGLAHVLATRVSLEEVLDLEDWTLPRPELQLELEDGTATAHVWRNDAYVTAIPPLQTDGAVRFLGVPEGNYTVRAQVDVPQEGATRQVWRTLSSPVESFDIDAFPTPPQLTVQESTDAVQLVWDPPQTHRWRATFRFDAHPAWVATGRANAATLPLFPALPVLTTVTLEGENLDTSVALPFDTTPSTTEQDSIRYEP